MKFKGIKALILLSAVIAFSSCAQMQPSRTVANLPGEVGNPATNSLAAYFPDKAAVFKKLVAFNELPFRQGNPYGEVKVKDLIADDIASHQNASTGIKLKMTCEDAFVRDAHDNFYFTDCTLKISRKSRVNSDITTTYTVKVIAKKLKGDASNSVSNLDLWTVERAEN